jgi:Family of unknown function (DUF6279)
MTTRISTLLRQRLLFSLLPTLAVALCVASCSQIGVGTFKFLYDHADRLLRRTIEHYVDLDKNQSRVLSTQIDTLYRWHRAHELPVYADALDDAAQRVARGLTSEDVTWMFSVVEDRRDIVARRIAADFSPFVLTLRLDQRSYIAEVFEHDNARYARRDINPGPEKTIEVRTAWIARLTQYWTGELTAAQLGRIRAVNAATAELPEVRLDERRRQQSAFLQLVGTKEGESVIRSTLASLLRMPPAEADESYKRIVTQYRQELSRMILDIDRSLSTRQRTTAVDRLHRFAHALRGLAAEPL